jgi:hypothetical protein
VRRGITASPEGWEAVADANISHPPKTPRIQSPAHTGVKGGGSTKRLLGATIAETVVVSVWLNDQSEGGY